MKKPNQVLEPTAPSGRGSSVTLGEPKMKNFLLPGIAWVCLLAAGCATVDVAPLAKYQALPKGTAVIIVQYDGYVGDAKHLPEHTKDQAGTIVEMSRDHLLLWAETESGWMTLLYPGRFIREIRVANKEPNQPPEPMPLKRHGSS